MGGAAVTAPNPSTAEARAIADELARAGCLHVVAAPGSRSTALVVAFAEHPRLRLHMGIDERSCGFVALGVAKATGRPGVVVTTSGTAAANLYPAVVEADRSGTPLLALTADRAPEQRNTGANQTIDQLRLFGPTVRWFCEVTVAEDRTDAAAYWRSTLVRAVAESMGWQGRPGPVHLNLPFREPTVPASDDGRAVAPPFAADLSGRPGGEPWTVLTPGRRCLNPADLQALAAELSDARRGLIAVGEGCGDPHPLHHLAERLRWPLVAEATSGARFGGAITTAHHLAAHEPWAQDHTPDVVLRIGRVGLSPHVARLLSRAPTQVLVPGNSDWPDPDRSSHRLVAADPGLLATQLAELVEGADPGWLTDWQQAETAARAAIDAFLDSLEVLSEPRLARDLAAATPAEGLFVVGSSMPVRDLDWFMASRHLRVLGNRGASGIDGLVSLATGAALAGGDPVVALLGDLALLHDLGALLTDPRPTTPLVLTVANNRGGGVFSFLPQARHVPQFERLFATPRPLPFPAVAEAMEVTYRRVQQPGEVVSSLREVAQSGGVHLLEAVVAERDANVEIHRRVAATVAAALGS